MQANAMNRVLSVDTSLHVRITYICLNDAFVVCLNDVSSLVQESTSMFTMLLNLLTPLAWLWGKTAHAERSQYVYTAPIIMLST